MKDSLHQLQSLETDVLVLGGGLAGYRAAYTAANSGVKVAMAYQAHGASPYIIGFNVPIGHADSRDNPEIYFEDIILGGYSLNDRRLVETLSSNSIKAFYELVDLGVPFAKNGNLFLQRHLSGNRYPRSVFNPDGIGKLSLRALEKSCNEIGVKTFSGWKVISLLLDKGEAVGALLFKKSSNEIFAIHSNSIVMAMGGIGGLYGDSTYPVDVSADSYAIALQSGAILIDMEFVQFEPTVVVYPENCKGMEMPTAMLGEGAHLVNSSGERFMFRHNPEHGERQIEKARMALCIQEEIEAGRGFSDGTILFDTTVLSGEKIKSYASHYKRLISAGIDPEKEGARVRPAAHSHMGGIYIDQNCFTGIPGFYAVGEAAGGVHGASRIAGNGASDVIITGGVGGKSAALNKTSNAKRDWNQIHKSALEKFYSIPTRYRGIDSQEIKESIRRIMNQCAGLIRDMKSLENGIGKISDLENLITDGFNITTYMDRVRALEATNMLLTAKIIIQSALAREESRGAHRRIDFPLKNDSDWLVHVAFKQDHNNQLSKQFIKIL